MSVSLEESQAYCHALMRRVAGNFYHGMRLLPEPKRHAMHALYAWMRWIDDIADGSDGEDAAKREAGAVREALEDWRGQTLEALKGGKATHVMFPALVEAVREFEIPLYVFDEAVEGQLQDLLQSHYHTFEELYGYCYRVASTVGIAAACIWRYRDRQALKLAEYRGIAFQLTNILRDLREDAARGRVYLPGEDLQAFGIERGKLLEPSLAVAELIAFEARRAREYYDASAALESMVAPDSRATLRIMTSIYGQLLERIEEDPLLPLSRRVSLSAGRKSAEIVRQLYLDQKDAIDGV